MTNHVHLLMTPKEDHTISLLMQYLGRLYVRYFNYTYSRSGSLFNGRFKSSLIQDDLYLLNCLQYIELNPVRAGMVTDPGNYRWSSYVSHGLGKQVAMLTIHPLYLSLGDNQMARMKRYREIIRTSLRVDVVEKIRHCTNKGLILGSEQFRQEFEQLTGDLAKG